MRRHGQSAAVDLNHVGVAVSGGLVSIANPADVGYVNVTVATDDGALGQLPIMLVALVLQSALIRCEKTNPAALSDFELSCC